jgi:hypothetical protein
MAVNFFSVPKMMLLLVREASLKGRPSTVDLLAITRLHLLVSHIKYIIYLCYRTSYLNVEVNCIKPSPSVHVPWGLSYKTFYCLNLRIFVKS